MSMYGGWMSHNYATYALWRMCLALSSDPLARSANTAHTPATGRYALPGPMAAPWFECSDGTLRRAYCPPIEGGSALRARCGGVADFPEHRSGHSGYALQPSGTLVGNDGAA